MPPTQARPLKSDALMAEGAQPIVAFDVAVRSSACGPLSGRKHPQRPSVELGFKFVDSRTGGLSAGLRRNDGPVGDGANV
jgi:hypothetical protein